MKAESRPIGTVCDVIAGQSPKSSAYNSEGDGLPFYQGKKDFGDRYIQAPQKWTTQITKEAEFGDILMSVRAPVGPINEATQKICIGRGLAAIRASEEILKDYLWYGLLWLQPEIVGHEGAVFSSINKKGIESLKLPLPPLEEQKRIVTVLDAAFEGLDRARAHVEANLQNARDLFERAVGKTFNELDGITKKLSSVSKIEYGYTAKANSEAVGPKFLRITDIQDGEVMWEDVPFCKIEEKKYAKFKMNVGDIVFARTGATTGKSWLMTEEYDAVFASYLIRVRTLVGELMPEFLAFYFQSDEYWEAVEKGTEGAAQGGFNASKLGEMEISIPSISEQQKAIENLSSQADLTKRLQAHYLAKLTDLDDLRQSLLQKAFAGELT